MTKGFPLTIDFQKGVISPKKVANNKHSCQRLNQSNKVDFSIYVRCLTSCFQIKSLQVNKEKLFISAFLCFKIESRLHWIGLIDDGCIYNINILSFTGIKMKTLNLRSINFLILIFDPFLKRQIITWPRLKRCEFCATL